MTQTPSLPSGGLRDMQGTVAVLSGQRCGSSGTVAVGRMHNQVWRESEKVSLKEYI